LIIAVSIFPALSTGQPALAARTPALVKALFTGEFACGPRWSSGDCDEFIAPRFTAANCSAVG
jgi:hypothetical protein